MTNEERKSLEAAGFRVGTVAEFLELTPEENEMVEVRVVLAMLVREFRAKESITQAEVAATMNPDQARKARLDCNDASVSVDQMLEVAFSLGARRKDVCKALAA